jgi:hypothetical protein
MPKKSAQPPQPRTIHWIDVRDHLPDDEISVLVSDKDGEIWYAWHENNAWFDATAGRLVHITHWADLPLPPEH